jgi:hypothetical protein
VFVSRSHLALALVLVLSQSQSQSHSLFLGRALARVGQNKDSRKAFRKRGRISNPSSVVTRARSARAINMFYSKEKRKCAGEGAFEGEGARRTGE